MALDGIVISSLVNELDTNITGGRITKIAQPEKDELLLTIKQSKTDENGKTARSTKRLTISVNPSLPLIYLTDTNKTSPLLWHSNHRAYYLRNRSFLTYMHRPFGTL